jgi:dihydroflavonol-4-reductase
MGGSFWSGNPVCVLGGTGFLGSHLVRLLLVRGARVRTLSLPSAAHLPSGQPTNLEHLSGDIREPADVRAAVAGARVVFLAAGPVAIGPSSGKRLDSHREGIRRVLDALPRGARLVHTSSIVAVGATRAGEPVLTEDSPFTLGGLRVGYVRAKRAAEEEALAAAAAGRDVVVVNPGYLFGPDDPGPSVMGRLCARFWRGRVLLAPPGGVNAVDVRDAAAGHLLAAERGAAGRRYILGGRNVGMRALFGMLAAAAGFRPRWLPRLPGGLFAAFACCAEGRGRLVGKDPFPSLEHARLNRLFWYVSSARAERELGYRARPLAETLADAHAWHAARDRLAPGGINRWLMRPTALPARRHAA